MKKYIKCETQDVSPENTQKVKRSTYTFYIYDGEKFSKVEKRFNSEYNALVWAEATAEGTTPKRWMSIYYGPDGDPMDYLKVPVMSDKLHIYKIEKDGSVIFELDQDKYDEMIDWYTQSKTYKVFISHIGQKHHPDLRSTYEFDNIDEVKDFLESSFKGMHLSTLKYEDSTTESGTLLDNTYFAIVKQ